MDSSYPSVRVDKSRRGRKRKENEITASSSTIEENIQSLTCPVNKTSGLIPRMKKRTEKQNAPNETTEATNIIGEALHNLKIKISLKTRQKPHHTPSTNTNPKKKKRKRQPQHVPNKPSTSCKRQQHPHL